MMVALSARTSIRLAAKHDPQWSQHADLIDVQVTEDQFQYTLKGPKDRVQAAYDLEYGTPGNPPNSLLRKTALREQQLLPLLLSKRMNAQVPHG
jgi:hypothetical protein